MIGILLAAWLASIGFTAAAVPPMARPTAPTAGPTAAPTASPTTPSCTCATAEATNGWCELHGVGYVASVKIRSKLLYESLDAHGHTLDLRTFTCPSCRRAIESDGFCEENKIGFVAKQAYFSRLTYELARGRIMDPARIACSVCRKNARSHGWCKKHNVGMAGRVRIDDWQSYQRAEKAIDIVQAASAAAARCEHCAVAMVTDSQCPFCRITYKDGKPIPPPGAQPAASAMKGPAQAQSR